MPFQAAGNVTCLTPKCVTHNFHQEGHVCSYIGFYKWSKKRQHCRVTHCYFASSAPYLHHFTSLCQRHAHAMCHHVEAHCLPAGPHQARKRSIRKNVFVSVVNNSSSRATSRHREAFKHDPSIVHKTAMVSAKGVYHAGLEDKPASVFNGKTSLNSAHLSNTEMASSEKVDSEAFVSKKHRKQLAGGIKGFKNWWNALHEVYQEDAAIWGYGTRPIFRVYEGQDRKIEKVWIDEEEIQRRQGVERFLPGFADDESKARAEQNILLAQSIAKDLAMGKRDINSYSTLFEVIKHPSNAKDQTGHKKLLSQINFAVHKAAPALRSVFMIVIPLYGLCILFGAYLLVSKRSEEDIIEKEKSAVNLKKMRKLKAQMNSHKGSADECQVTLAPSDFIQKLLEVREMARQVRSEEGMQKAVMDSDIDVEEYQPQEESAQDTSILMVGNAASTEQGGTWHEDFIDTIKNESIASTMDDTRAKKLSNNGTDVTFRPPPKVKPRIITSLDEAMTVLGNKQTVLPNGGKSSLDLNRTAVRALTEPQSQAKQESGVISNDSVTAAPNGLNNLRRSVAEATASKVDKILPTSLGGKEKAGETQSIQSEARAPQSDVFIMPDKMGPGTLDSLAPEGPAPSAQNSNSNFEGGSDGLQDSDKTMPLSPVDVNSESGLVNKIQISSVARPSEVNNSAQTLKHTPLSRPRTLLEKYPASKSVLNADTDEVVGSGQPLRRRETHRTSSGPMSNTKRWSKELQRKYDLERDPETRELMKEVGSELDSWVTEEEVEELSRLASKLREGDDDVVNKYYEKVQKKIKQEKETFGLEAVLEKYKEYQPKPEDELWWLDLRCVLCLMVVSAKQEGEGLYGLDMTIDFEGMSNRVARHVIAFEDRRDASNFCHLVELRSGSRFRLAEVCPFSPKKLYEFAKEEGFKVTVLKTGQIQTNIDQTLEEVEEQILGIGRSVYWEKMERDRSIDIDSVLHQRFGL